jgi:hypothetical protein
MEAAMKDQIPAATGRRVSTRGKRHENQAAKIDEFADHHGHKIVKTYPLNEFAWNAPLAPEVP